MRAQTMSRTVLFTIAAVLAAISLALLLGSRPALGDDPVVYVDASASPGGDGQSWSTAYRYLQDALDETNAYGSSRYEIWVAQGVYYPDADSDGDHTVGSPSESFRISYNNVQLYGGFTGGETARQERDWETNTTVLSGDIGGDDTTDANGFVTTTTPISGRNANNVVWLDGESYEPITGTTVIDGFTITAGQAISEQEAEGGGMCCAGGGEGAECSPTLKNVTFSGNTATDGGGALYNDGTGSGISSPILVNVAFKANATDYSGGAMYNRGTSGTSSPILTNVTFSSNSGSSGGAMYNDGFFGGVSNPTLMNVTFSDNSASSGGAVYNDAEDGTSSPTFINVTFNGNSASSGGAIYNHGTGFFGAGTSSPTLSNVILWSNTATGSGDQMLNNGAAPAIGYSLVEGGWDGSGVHNIDSTVTDLGGNIDADPQFVAAETENLHLQDTSPAVDAGNSSAVPSSVTTDLDGNPRIVDGTGDGVSVVDLGAYEFQTVALTIMKEGNGAVTSTPGSIDCGNVCTSEFVAGTPVTLTAEPDPDWVFTGWSGDVKSAENPLLLTVENNISITVTFVLTGNAQVYLPLVASGVSGGISSFELGGHIRDWGFPYEERMHYAGMDWAKVQIRYPNDASGIIAASHDEGFKIQLSALGSADIVTEPGFEQDFADWVGGLAAAGADAIEVWNEPNIDREWPSGQISPELYTGLLCASYSAIKAANGEALVISAAPAPTGYFDDCNAQGCNDVPWLEGLYAAGAASCMDYIGAHHVAGATSPSARSGHPADPSGTSHIWYFLWQTEEYFQAFEGGLPLFYTELGYASQEGVPPFPQSFSWATGTTNAEQAAWLTEAAQLSMSTGMANYIMIWNVDFPRYGYDPQDGYAIIRPDGSCPSCESLHDLLGSR